VYEARYTFAPLQEEAYLCLDPRLYYESGCAQNPGSGCITQAA
jgi:hypothetical protein